MYIVYVYTNKNPGFDADGGQVRKHDLAIWPFLKLIVTDSVA